MMRRKLLERERSVQKQVRKSGNKPVRSATPQSDDSGDNTSPSVAREDGSPISHVKQTNLPPSEQTKSNNPSVIDEPGTNSQGPLGKLSQSTIGRQENARDYWTCFGSFTEKKG